ncbi:MAG: MEDS domain-containing protein [Candidatus Omnitrophica bacterium]|nr:MEDS domain-containing protein [Candidatus Omnitrophota bacterium]
MDERLLKTGIDVVGDVSWGTHICAFYRSRQDLIDILVPYFKLGLRNNEFCFWAVSNPLTVDSAKKVLTRQVHDLNVYLNRQQLQIVDAKDWYAPKGSFDAEGVLQKWIEKEKFVLEKGFTGLRVAANIFAFKKEDWKKISYYESKVNETITRYRAIAICAYPVDRLMISQILETGASHQFIISRQKKKWSILKSAVYEDLQEEISNI